MAHFYSSISGQAGEATRMGSKRSGIQGWVQGWGTRLSVRMWYHEATDRDTGTITIGPGGSNHRAGSLSIGLDNLDAIVDAIGGGDPKVMAIVRRIHNEFAKLDAEAPKALPRIERRAKIRENKERKERIEKERRLKAIRDSITSDERENYRRVVLELDPEDTDSLFREDDRCDDFIVRPYGHVEPRRDENGHLIISEGDGYEQRKYDLTDGVKIYDSKENRAA